MGLLTDTPHSAMRIRPGSSRDASNATVLVYTGDSAVRKTIRGFYQTRGGRFVLVEEGMGYNLNAFFYTTETDLLNQDILIISIPGSTGNFRVMNVESKYDDDGSFSHNRLSLQKDQAVLV